MSWEILDPIIPYKGNKKVSMPKIINVVGDILKKYQYTYYVELFLGSGCVVGNLLNVFDEAGINPFKDYICNEWNPQILQFHVDVRDNVEDVIEEIIFYSERVNSQETYQKVVELNKQNPSSGKLYVLHAQAFFARFNYDENFIFTSKFKTDRDGHAEKRNINLNKVIPNLLRYNELYNKFDVKFVNKSYEDVKIPVGSFLYLDPPYATTSEYNTKLKFDYDAFDDWVEEQPSFLISTFKHYYIPQPAIHYKLRVPKSTVARKQALGYYRVEFLRFVHPDIKNSVEIKEE